MSSCSFSTRTRLRRLWRRGVCHLRRFRHQSRLPDRSRGSVGSRFSFGGLDPTGATWSSRFLTQAWSMDTPGFEAVENAMVILQAPCGQVAAEVSIKQTETYEEYVAAEEI